MVEPATVARGEMRGHGRPADLLTRPRTGGLCRTAPNTIRGEVRGGGRFSHAADRARLFSAAREDALALLEWCPQALLYGFWQSHLSKKRSQAKLARSWVSEIVRVRLATTETRVPRPEARSSHPASMRKWTVFLALLVAGLATAYVLRVSASRDQPGRRVLAPFPPVGGHDERASAAPSEDGVVSRMPCKGVTVSEGDDLASVANSSPRGTTFCISGFHRLSDEIIPKDDQRFIGVDRAVLSGSTLVTSFSRENGFWMITDQTQDYSGANPNILNEPCMEHYEACHFPEDVYVDDMFLHQVLSLGELESGRYYFDYDADKIYLADDPVGHKVEVSVVRRAFSNHDGAANVLIQGLVIEKFSSYAGQDGAVGAFNGVNWLVEDNEIRLNHGSGILAGSDRMVIRRNYIHHNGCGGIMGSEATNLLIDRNEIAFNNALNYLSYAWSCGGGKLAGSDGVILRENYFHDNNGFGFWTDIQNVNVVYENNTFEDNSMGGLLHEINDGTAGPTLIRDNVFRRNGFGHPTRVMFGAAIIITASNHVEIIGNVLVGNAHGITLNYTPRAGPPDVDLTVHDIVVHENVIGLRYGDNTVTEVGRVGFYTATVGAPAPTRITFADNTYFLGDPASGQHFSLPDPAVPNTLSTATDWKAAGFDVSSRFLSLTEFPSDT